MSFANRHLCIGMHDADVGTQTNLNTSSQSVTMHCSNHGNRNLLPNPSHLLSEMGDAP